MMIAKTIARRFKAYPFACAVGIAGFALYAGSANAAPFECVLKDINRDTGWSIRFDDAQVSACSFVGNAGTGRNKGTLDLTLKITNKNPIPIEFVESDTEKAKADSFGFRITWHLTLNNQFQTLKGIRGRALDNNAELEDDMNQFVEDDHPGFAHFHQDPGFIPNPFGAKDCDCESERDFKVKGNAFLRAFSSTAEVKGIGVHQIEEQGLRRNFTVRVAPLPAN